MRMCARRVRDNLTGHCKVQLKHIFHSDIQWLDSLQFYFAFDFHFQILDSLFHTLISCKASCKHSIFVSAQGFFTPFDG